MTYRAPVAEMRFLLEHVLGSGRLAETERFAEATPETVEAMLGERRGWRRTCWRRCGGPGTSSGRGWRTGWCGRPRLRRGLPGDRRGRLGRARGRSRAWRHGAAGHAADLRERDCSRRQHGAVALPAADAGQIEALEHHADDALKAVFLPKLVVGAWTGTMNLTEPQAGSDVGAVRSRAEPDGRGTYAVTGQKIFISWGDHDVAGERLPPGAGAAAGRRRRAPAASRFSWCRSTCRTATAPGRRTASGWCRSSTRWGCTAARPA